MIMDLGINSYEETLRFQRGLAELRNGSKISDTVILVEHPDIYTEGRHTLPEDSLPSSIKVERGGSITYHGYLMASRSVLTESTGICRMNAKKGEPVSIDRVKGIINFERGKIDIYTLPVIDDAGYNPADIRRKLSGILANGRRIGVIGEEAFALLASMKKADFEFATLASAYDAALRGISSIILVSRSRFIFVSAELSEQAKKFPQVVFSVSNI